MNCTIIKNEKLKILVCILQLKAQESKKTLKNNSTMTEDINQIDPVFTNNKVQGSAEYFTGTVWISPVLSKDKNNDFSIGNVMFEPQARTHWHTHPRGQVLLILAGKGFYQEEGKPARPISKGDIVNIPAHVNHWHGAAPDSKFVHIAITNYVEVVNVVWGKPVTDEEYKAAIKEQ